MTAKFHASTIDQCPRLLEQSYQLRYQVYCVERHYLAAEDYPDEREFDEFDRYSVHVGVVDGCGELAGTARVVSGSSAGLPLFGYCSLFPGDSTLFAAGVNLVEISRLAVSRDYSRRRDDPFRRVPPPRASTDDCAPASAGDRRRGRQEVFGTLIKAIYQAAKRIGATHWIVATEPSLQRRIVEYGLPFKLVGPSGEYGGEVAPYLMAVAEFDQVILGGQIDHLEHFLDGLEPQFWPTRDRPGTAAPTSVDSTPRTPEPFVV